MRGADMRIELHIGRLVVDGLGAYSQDELVAAITGELRLAIARDFGWPQVAARQAMPVPRLRATLARPVAGATAASAGQAIGATLAGALTGARPGINW